MGLFDWLRGRRPKPEPARPLYEAIVGQARQPGFFRDLGLPDTVDGRFESIVLHLFLLLHRLKREGEAGAVLGQALFDFFCLDMDRSLREMGAGDLGVGLRVKRMAKGFYGRVAAYDAALGRDDDAALAEALKRNVYGTMPTIDAALANALGRYVRDAVRLLDGQAVADFQAGRVAFPVPPVLVRSN
jgi:cytochrome b pre-mRNA-processing protein 3